MKTISAKAIVAVLAVTAGLTAAAPAFAQPAPPAPAQTQLQPGKDHGNFRRDNHQGQNRPGRPDHRGGGSDLLDLGRGQEAVEISLVRLGHRIDLTAEQQPKFDALKTAALKAAADFETTVKGLRPTEAPATRPSITDRLNNRITIGTAQVDALKAVQPTLTAFFDSLTDAQKAQLTPNRSGPGGWKGHENGPRSAAPAPAEAPTPKPAG